MMGWMVCGWAGGELFYQNRAVEGGRMAENGRVVAGMGGDKVECKYRFGLELYLLAFSC
jgi:hypothetical protein